MNSPTILASATVTNVIPEGAGFAIKHETGESCYIPASVVHSANIRPGMVIEAQMVINPMEANRERTPYLVTYVPTKAPVQMELPLDGGAAESTPADIKAFVKRTMNAGGVWTTLELFQEYMGDQFAKHGDSPEIYATIGNEQRRMFNEDECSKWSFYRRGSQSKASREWFSCYPENVDVAEFE